MKRKAGDDIPRNELKVRVVTYISTDSICSREDCPNVSNECDGVFVLSEGARRIEVCKKCIVKYPSLMFTSRAILHAVKKIYVIKGRYIKRKYACNQIGLDRGCRLLKILSSLKDKGYRVPVFGREDSIVAVDENVMRSENEWCEIKVVLHYWQNPRFETEGYSLRSV